MSDNEKKYPISEIFVSPQGEGIFCGVLMCFIRLAGCSVGKPFPDELHDSKSQQKRIGTCLGPYRILPIYTECCTLYDGRKFLCDTDYRVKEQLTVKEIYDRIPEGIRYVCITGGEPFIHSLSALAGMILNSNIKVHIETSGTKPMESAFGPGAFNSWVAQQCWITVSPKLGVLPEMINRADEIKLLVDEHFDPAKLPVIHHKKLVYIQPVNDEHAVNQENLQRCVELQKLHPTWRISVQLHKILEVR